MAGVDFDRGAHSRTKDRVIGLTLDGGTGSDWASYYYGAANVTVNLATNVNTGGDATSSVLQYCAQNTSSFYLVTSASQTTTVFNAIGTQLSKLRVSK